MRENKYLYAKIQSYFLNKFDFYSFGIQNAGLKFLTDVLIWLRCDITKIFFIFKNEK